MNKTSKIIAGLSGVLLLGVIASGFYLSRNLPVIVKKAVETYAPKTTGTAVKLNRVRFNFMTGSVTLKNFVVKNPKGYKSDHAFQFDGLVFRLDLSTVFNKIIVIREFSIDGASIIAEQRGLNARTNLQEIADYAQRAKPAPAKSNKNKGPRLIVSRLVFSDNTVDLVSESLGARKIKLPDIVLKDIGKKEGGLTPDQLTQRVTQLVTAQVSNAVKDELKRMAVEKGKESMIDKMNSWLGK
jgi:hypothetical protein